MILLVMMPFSEFGPAESAEGQVVEQQSGRGAERDQRRAVERIRDADALERAVQGIAQREGEASARLRVVLQVLQTGPRAGSSCWPVRICGLLRLIVIESARVNREAGLQRAIQEIRLGESELEVALADCRCSPARLSVSPKPRKLLVL